MAKYIRQQIIEARKYDGPKLNLVHDELGEQTAAPGDYLLGSERGKISVIPAAKFEKEYAEYSPTSEDEALAAAHTEIAGLKRLNEQLSGSNASLGIEVAELVAAKADLSSRIEDQGELSLEVASLTAQLASEKANGAALQVKLDALTAAEQAKASAQAALEAAQVSVADTLKQ